MSVLLSIEARRSLLRLASSTPVRKALTTTISIQTRLLWIDSRRRSSVCSNTTNANGGLARYRGLMPLSVGIYAHSRRTLFSAKVLRDYEELPREYKDQDGLSFRSSDLKESETDKIFSEELTAPAANHLLRVLHGRRVAGTLDDPAYAKNTTQFTQKQQKAGLTYLRKAAPVDEIRNAGLRAEDELAQLEIDMAKAAQAKTSKDAPVDEPVEVKIDPVYGQNHFDQIRARNQARSKAHEAALEEQRKEELVKEEAAQAGPLIRREEYARSISNPKIVKYYEAAQSDMAEPPQMSAWRRIGPSAALFAAAVAALYGIAQIYEEPAAKYRMFPDIPTSWATVGTLIGANALVYLGWRIPPLWKFFNKHMMVIVATIRPTTLFTAVFSHQRISHLFINMVPLWFVGTALHDEIGRANFLALFLTCGSAGFLGSLVTYTLRGWLNVTALGASGATLGLCSAYFWEHRMDGFKIFGLPEDGVHGIVFLALILAMQLTALGKTAKLQVDIASHLTGIGAGIAGMEVISKRAERDEKSTDRKNIIEMKLDVPKSDGESKWWKFW